MGRKRAQDVESSIPIWIPKKPKTGRDDPMTPLNALMQYSSKFKLGQIKYQIIKQPPNPENNKWTMRALIGEDEMGFGEGDTREAAMQKGALVTLHLFDPTGKSVCSNIIHYDSSQLDKLEKMIESVKPEDISRAKGTLPPAYTAPPPTLIPLHQFSGPPGPPGYGMMQPPPYPGMMPPYMSPYGMMPPPHGPPGYGMHPPPYPGMMPPPYGFQPGMPQPGWAPPPSQGVPPHGAPLTAPSPPPSTNNPTVKTPSQVTDTLIFNGAEDLSMEERRAMKYNETKAPGV